MAETHDVVDLTDNVSLKSDAKTEIKGKLTKKDDPSSIKMEEEQHVLNVTPANLREISSTPAYVNSINELPSFDEEELAPIATDVVTVENISRQELSAENEFADHTITTEEIELPDPYFEELYFPNLNGESTLTGISDEFLPDLHSERLSTSITRAEPSDQEITEPSVTSTTVTRTVVRNYEIPRLQDIMKTYMLGCDFPENVTLDDIDRICRCKLVRLKVVSTNNSTNQPSVLNKVTTKTCRVKLKLLQQEDLIKLGVLTVVKNPGALDTEQENPVDKVNMETEDDTLVRKDSDHGGPMARHKIHQLKLNKIQVDVILKTNCRRSYLSHNLYVQAVDAHNRINYISGKFMSYFMLS